MGDNDTVSPAVKRMCVRQRERRVSRWQWRSLASLMLASWLDSLHKGECSGACVMSHFKMEIFLPPCKVDLGLLSCFFVLACLLGSS